MVRFLKTYPDNAEILLLQTFLLPQNQSSLFPKFHLEKPTRGLFDHLPKSTDPLNSFVTHSALLGAFFPGHGGIYGSLLSKRPPGLFWKDAVLLGTLLAQ